MDIRKYTPLHTLDRYLLYSPSLHVMILPLPGRKIPALWPGFGAGLWLTCPVLSIVPAPFLRLHLSVGAITLPLCTGFRRGIRGRWSGFFSERRFGFRSGRRLEFRGGSRFGRNGGRRFFGRFGCHRGFRLQNNLFCDLLRFGCSLRYFGLLYFDPYFNLPPVWSFADDRGRTLQMSRKISGRIDAGDPYVLC